MAIVAAIAMDLRVRLCEARRTAGVVLTVRNAASRVAGSKAQRTLLNLPRSMARMVFVIACS